MTAGGDVFTTLMWGLRKYAWIVIVFVVGIGVLVPLAQSRTDDGYEARAYVGPSGAIVLQNLDVLPRLGENVFSNGAVADTVRRSLGLSGSAAVVPERVELVTAQDNIVFTVIGRGDNPGEAKDVANLAASTFSLELSNYNSSVGEFTIQRQAEAPAAPVATVQGGYLAIGIGLIAGAIAGLGVVALILVLRRPLVDPRSAEEATGVPVLGRIRLPRGGGQIDERDLLGVALLCRRSLSSSPQLVMLASPPHGASRLTQLQSAMTAFLDRARMASASPPHSGYDTPALDHPANQPTSQVPRGQMVHSPPEVVVMDEHSLQRWVRRPEEALTLLVVREGTGMRSLRNAAAVYFTGGPTGLVLVANAPRWRRRTGRSASSKMTSREFAQRQEGRPKSKPASEH